MFETLNQNKEEPSVIVCKYLSLKIQDHNFRTENNEECIDNNKKKNYRIYNIIGFFFIENVWDM